MNEHIYELEGVSKSYGSRTVLKIDELRIDRGETFAILGPSGSGKTTLLKLLLLVENPDSGSVVFCGNPTNGLATPLDLRRRMAMVFQRPLVLSRSVKDNVLYGLRIQKQKNQHERVGEDLLKKFNLFELRKSFAPTLSGGEKQRVALARTLALEPEVLLLDEPTANLEMASVTLTENMLKELRKNDRQTTIIFSTHNVFQAKRLADRVCLLIDGNVVEVSSCSDFFNHSANPKTAAFLRGDIIT